MIPGVPPGKMWLASVKAHLGVGERNPKAARMSAITKPNTAPSQRSILKIACIRRPARG